MCLRLSAGQRIVVQRASGVGAEQWGWDIESKLSAGTARACARCCRCSSKGGRYVLVTRSRGGVSGPFVAQSGVCGWEAIILNLGSVSGLPKVLPG
jgi:hypothetical protein